MLSERPSLRRAPPAPCSTRSCLRLPLPQPMMQDCDSLVPVLRDVADSLRQMAVRPNGWVGGDRYGLRVLEYLHCTLCTHTQILQSASTSMSALSHTHTHTHTPEALGPKRVRSLAPYTRPAPSPRSLTHPHPLHSFVLRPSSPPSFSRALPPPITLKHPRLSLPSLLCSSLLAPLSSPLFAAIHGNHLSAVRALVDAGADVFAARRDGVTAIHMCAKFGSVEVLEVLLQSPPFSRTTLAAAAASATDAVDAAAVVAVTPAALEMESAAVTTSTAATLQRGRGLMAGDAVTRATESPPSNTPSDDDLNAGGVRGVRGVGGRGAGSGVVPVPRPEPTRDSHVAPFSSFFYFHLTKLTTHFAHRGGVR